VYGFSADGNCMSLGMSKSARAAPRIESGEPGKPLRSL